MKKDEYDVIIIGAGIGGLVCGCRLAKAGKKVLIIEKNEKPGGYCTSFSRGNYYFNSAVHSLGSCRKNGILEKILNELKIFDSLNITRNNPSDIFITPDHKIKIFDRKLTMQEFQRCFPNESKQIKDFFYFVNNSDQNAIYFKTKNLIFSDLLEKYFKNYKLKSIISLFILANTGLSSSLISSFSGIMLLREFMCDGGYKCKYGMQNLSDALASKFSQLGGTLLLSTKIKNILLKKSEISGLILDSDIYLSTNCLILNGDLMYAFLSLFRNGNNIYKIIIDKLSKCDPSLSAFLVYLGIRINDELGFERECGGNLWYLPDYDIDLIYKRILEGKLNYNKMYTLIFDNPHLNNSTSHKKKENIRSLTLFVNAPIKNKRYWDINKEFFAKQMIKRAEVIWPKLSLIVDHIEIATPIILYEKTYNYKGACYGWASTLKQAWNFKLLKTLRLIKGLYVASHWNPRGHGIPFVSYSGYAIAKSILNKKQ